jgi:hypothetical protein
MQTKINFGHPKWPGHFEKKKMGFDLKWREMQTKMSFRHTKRPPEKI